MDKISLLKNVVEENPKSASSWYLLGLEYEEGRMFGEALSAFSEALKFSNDEMRDKILLELAKLSDALKTSQGSNNTKESIKDNEIEESDSSWESEESEADGAPEDEPGEFKREFRVIDFKNDARKVFNDSELKKDKVSFADVGGLEKLKETIRMKIIKPFIQPGLFDKFKKKIGGGILLYGPPGCGKTFIAKATAGECGANFIPVHITDILDPYIGVSEQNVKDIFSSARAKKPCVLFFDEIDTLGFNRAKMSSNLMRSVVDQLLSEIEGIDSNLNQILIIGATNMPWDIDPALKRPGRFDRMIFVPPPDKEARLEIFRLKMSGRPSTNIDYEWLASKTELYSGADIENVIDLAAENVLNEIMQTGTERPILMKDMEGALKASKSSTKEWLRTIKNYVTYSNQSGLYDDVEEYLRKVKSSI